MNKITYRDIEPVTRQLIFSKIEGDKLDEFGLMKARHFDAIFEAIADDPIGETPLAVRADVERALGVFGPTESGDASMVEVAEPRLGNHGHRILEPDGDQRANSR